MLDDYLRFPCRTAGTFWLANLVSMTFTKDIDRADSPNWRIMIVLAAVVAAFSAIMAAERVELSRGARLNRAKLSRGVTQSKIQVDGSWVGSGGAHTHEAIGSVCVDLGQEITI